jgi:lipoate-protein ligase A
MYLLELTLPSPEANIALDEALLEAAEAAGDEREVLRIWESPAPLVVIGRSSRIEEEVHVARCRERGIPVIRRTSGGASIVAGPGCLMYAVALSYARRPQLKNLDEAHRTVLEPLAAALAQVAPGVRWAGTSDLAIGAQKFSGNSLRCKRSHLVYHGTLLYDFPLVLIGELLKTPPRQPEYRQGRAHGDFIANLPIGRAELRASLLSAFHTEGVLPEWPEQLTAQLVREKYALASWNARL